MRATRNALLIGVLLIVGCTPSDQGAAPSSTAAILTVSPTPSATTPSSGASPSAGTSCRGLPDNSGDPVPPLSEADTVYYLFGCDYDNRLIIRVDHGIGHVVVAELQSEFTFALVDFSQVPAVATETFQHDLAPIQLPYVFTGGPLDLHVEGLARAVGPTTDPQDYFAQDCLDYMYMGSKQNCDKLGGKSTSLGFIVAGDKAKWVNEYGT